MFEIVTYSALHLQHTALALATVKTDGIALFDLSYCPEKALQKAQENLRQFLLKVPSNARIGVKIPVRRLETFRPILTQLQEFENRTIVVLSEMGQEPAFEMPAFIQQASYEFWAEASGSSQKTLFQSIVFSALVLKGSENGGRIGEENTFVLAQSFLSDARKPVYVQGSVGFHTGAACIAAGASGLVLDDQLLGLAESPLLPWKNTLKQLGTGNTRILSNEVLSERVISHPTFTTTNTIGWGNPKTYTWPAGQAIGMANSWANKYKTLGRLVKAIRGSVHENIKAAKASKALAPDGALAKAHGTEYPVVQGPMTRVSDRSAFIDDVATAGALPFLALSMMSGNPMKTLLEETQRRLEGKPWGVGVLGFVPEDLRQEQLRAIKEVKPQFALIAGGTVDQVMELEGEGIQTYLHAPTASLLQIFLDRGCNRFVFEGRECGGHVGPLGSFTLWEAIIDCLLELPAERAQEVQVLFAGGIHDAQSAMMVAAMSGRLAAKGVKVGVLMGTAYLFTDEVCTSGAVLEGFQKAALSCEETAVIETGPGHAIRCIPSPFVEEFNSLKTASSQNTSPQELTAQLEKMTLGRLRMASKGKERTSEGALKDLSDKEQYEKGMFMVGQVANMHSHVQSMATLHQQVCVDGNRSLMQLTESAEDGASVDLKPSSIAIVGMSTILPGAKEVDDFWNLVLNYQKALTEVPKERWDWKLYYDNDLKTRDKIVSKWGGFIDDLLFDPLKFGIPPHSLKSISPAQLILLEAVDRALQHGGYQDGGFDREHTSVIVGSDGTSALKNQYAARTMLPQFVDLLSEEDLDRLPEWNEESFAGVLTNVLAGRVANRFNLGGANFSVDAACASSLTAIDLAIKELEGGNSNMVIAAGIDIAQSPFSYTAFSKTQALSPTGESIPFDEEANGIVISEGVGVVLLKKLEDAERDGDTVYGVLKGSACSSDGKGLGLTAPRSSGQEKAFARAYKKAGFSPATIGYYEAHATGTAVGDKVELQSVNSVLKSSKALANSCALGSVKSLVGHTKTSAGVVGLIKTAFSLYHKTLSPHQVKTKPLYIIQESDSPVCLLEAPKPWYTTSRTPRRAGVSAFGFGGTNTHVVLEEYADNTIEAAYGHQKRPAELFLFAAHSTDELLQNLTRWTKAFERVSDAPLRDLAYVASLESKSNEETPVRLSIVAKNHEELFKHLEKSIQKLSREAEVVLPPQICLRTEAGGTKGKMAFLFPGQGAQHLQMARENTLYFKQLRAALDRAHTTLNTQRHLGDLMYPETAFDEEGLEDQRKQLTATEHAQPAIGTVSLGYLNILLDLGLEPEAVAGHSYGEFTALCAAEMISETDFLTISEKRGALMGKGCEVDGSMAVVKAGASEIESFLTDFVSIANLNAPKQTVLSGERGALLQVIEVLKNEGFKAQEIEVAGPFHTQYFESAQKPLEEAINTLQLKKAKRTVYSNSKAGKYPKSTKQVKELLSRHLLSPVKFADEIVQMHKDGVRLFVEVGPKQILTGLVGQILDQEEHKSLAVEGHGGGVKGLLIAIANIYAEGYDLDLTTLFENRVSHYTSLEELLTFSEKPKASKAAVWINGAGIRALDESQLQTGKLPVLTRENRKEVTAVATIQQKQTSPSHMSKRQFSEQGILEGYQAYQKTMQQFLSTQEAMVEKFFSMETDAVERQPLADKEAPKAIPEPALVDVKETTVVDKVLSAKVSEAVSSEVTVSREGIGLKMIDIICERTGYPKDMLATDVDLEAELGIDSIKRIEILDKILKELPAAHEAQLQGQMQPLMRTKTIDAFLDIAFDSSLSLTEPAKTESNEPVQLFEPLEAVDSYCPRFVMKAVPSELDASEVAVLEGLYLLTSDDSGIAKGLKKEIEGKGGIGILLSEKIVSSPELLEENLNSILREYGQVAGVVHCAPLSKVAMPESLKEWKRLSQVQSKSLFQILRLLAKENEGSTKAAVKKVVAASLFGGHFGRTQKEGKALPLAGSNCGLLKALNKEWQGLEARAVDFDSQLLESEIIQRLFNELNHVGEEVEVGYPEGERMLFQPVEVDLEQKDEMEAEPLGPEAVVLATGGAKGITSEICKSMVVPGMTLILAGRSEQIDLELRPEGVSSASFAKLKEQGVKVVYHSVDLREEEGVKNLLESIYEQYGRLDAVIHGAGIIEDRNIDQKGLSSFDKVFDTKVDTSFLLYKYLRPESLKLLVFFGSVSGRFGNQGQTDYAAANEVLNRFAWQLSSQWKETRILTINWGPWDTVGMASPMVIRLLKSEGMEPIGPRAGCEFFLREIKWGQQEMAEVIAGQGPWAQAELAVPEGIDFADIFNLTAIGSNGELTEH